MTFLHKTMMMALICAMATGAAISANAAPGDRPGPRYQMQPYNGPQLTPDQMAQARKIYDESLAQTDDARQALGIKRGQLDQELASPNPDSAKIESLSREIGELRGKLLAARSEARARLAQQGLPPDCFGPCNGYYGGMMGPYGNGWGDYYHHGRGHGGHHRGWGCYPGRGMMGGWW